MAAVFSFFGEAQKEASRFHLVTLTVFGIFFLVRCRNFKKGGIVQVSRKTFEICPTFVTSCSKCLSSIQVVE